MVGKLFITITSGTEHATYTTLCSPLGIISRISSPFYLPLLSVLSVFFLLHPRFCDTCDLRPDQTRVSSLVRRQTLRMRLPHFVKNHRKSSKLAKSRNSACYKRHHNFANSQQNISCKWTNHWTKLVLVYKF